MDTQITGRLLVDMKENPEVRTCCGAVYDYFSWKWTEHKNLVGKWHKVGVLGCVSGQEIFQALGVEKHDRVVCLTNEEGWLLGISPIEDLQPVWDAIPSLEKLSFEVDDKVVWTGTSTGEFTSAMAWNLTRETGEEIVWWEVAWCHRNIPKHSFVV